MNTLPRYKPPMSLAKVRTKTGCLGCRARRKKCDEDRPRCLRCTKAGLDCVWPSAEQHIDRRNRTKKCYPLPTTSNPGPKSGNSARIDKRSKSTVQVYHTLQEFECSPLNDAANNADVVVVVETAVLNHFTSSFLPLLFLSIADPCFYNDILVRAFSLSHTYRHLEATMLACGAMHMRAMSNHVSTPKTPFHYYSDAVTAVSRTLRNELGAHGDFSGLDTYNNDSFDALIISVILLYIYGTWTAADPRLSEDRRHHVQGATQLLKIRYCQSTNRFPLRTIDRVIIESVLCQHFLLTARHPFSPNSFLDADFWASMEWVLGGAESCTNVSKADRPILGVLLPLCRLILTIVQLKRSTPRADTATLAATKQEMAYWEAFIEGSQLENADAMGIYDALVVEYVLAASLMLDWIVNVEPGQELHPLNIPYGESWQLQRAMGVLRCMVHKHKWTRCYLGMWPLQIFGYAADAEEDTELIREDLARRSHVMGIGETTMVRTELEALWRTRRDSAKGFDVSSMELQTKI